MGELIIAIILIFVSFLCLEFIHDLEIKTPPKKVKMKKVKKRKVVHEKTRVYSNFYGYYVTTITHTKINE